MITLRTETSRIYFCAKIFEIPMRRTDYIECFLTLELFMSYSATLGKKNLLN